MIPLLLGVFVVGALWWLSQGYAKADPKALVRLAKQAGGWLALAVAGLLLVRGRLDMAIFVAMGGAWLLGWSSRLPGFLNAGAWLGGAAQAGAPARLRSAAVEIVIDRTTSAIRGTVLAGPHAGRDLDGLSVPDLLGLRRACVAGDPEGVRLLEAYLDRRAPGWRQDGQTDADLGPRRPAQPGAMTEEEAYQVLGLLRGASAEEVRRAHRGLMKRLHPDQGGSDYLAARVNAAKDVLLNRHR